jgi:hypothetical protein
LSKHSIECNNHTIVHTLNSKSWKTQGAHNEERKQPHNVVYMQTHEKVVSEDKDR